MHNELSQQESEMESLQTPQYTAMSEHSLLTGTPQAIRDWLMSSQADSPVSRSPLPESKPGKTTPGTCGPQLSPSSVKSNHAIAFLRTYQGFCPLPTIVVESADAGISPTSKTTGRRLSFAKVANLRWLSPQLTLFGTSETFSGTWPKAGMMRDGAFYRQPNWEVRIREIGSGLWLTPTSEDHKSDGPAAIEKYRLHMQEGNALPASAQRLRNQVLAREMFPTPTVTTGAQTAQNKTPGQTGGTSLAGYVQMFPTPSAKDSGLKAERLVDKNGDVPSHWNQRMFDKKTGRLAQRGLTQFVKMFPTPVASGKLNGGTRDFNRLHDLKDSGQITEDERKSMSAGNGGKLNPGWVEWMMNWPTGWTSIDPMPLHEFKEWESDGDWWGHEHEIQRLEHEVEFRRSRIQAIGNGQVPICAAVAFRLLTADLID